MEEWIVPPSAQQLQVSHKRHDFTSTQIM